MKRADIDPILDIMAKEAAEQGDDSLLPGAISFHADTWIARSLADLPTTCVSIAIGIRYRGVQILISSQRENKVLNRAEDGGQGKPYMDLEPAA